MTGEIHYTKVTVNFLEITRFEQDLYKENYSYTTPLDGKKCNTNQFPHDLGRMCQILNFIWMNKLIRITKMFLKERMI